jgi:site-specific DNA-methyltransferase (adenine-specific)
MIIHGDCLEVLKTLDDNSVDAVVTDPPYGLSFMGKKWDYDVPSIEVWQECLRVLKPGGKLMVLEFSKVWKPLAPLYDL